MTNLTKEDLKLIEIAKETIKRNYDKENFNHTVGSALRCKNGKIYNGVNVYTLHGACGEMIAIGSAITAGEREFDCIVAIRGEEGEEILPPCGNCRQLLSDYMPDCDVILKDGEKLIKVKAKELLPYSYSVEN